MTKILVLPLLLVCSQVFADRASEPEKVIFKVEPSPFTDANNAAKADTPQLNEPDEMTEAGISPPARRNPLRAQDINTAAKQFSNNINNN